MVVLTDNRNGWLLSTVFSMEFVICLFALIGVYAICWWLIDNLKSVVQVLRTLLTPYFQPQEVQSLNERYGGWAGN